MSSEAATSAVPASVATVPAPLGGLGDRVRALRVGKGLTQTDLAGDRFSKEYISQIERGKTRPTAETVGWLAERLGVDPEFLTRGVAADVRDRVEALLAQAEAMSVSHRYDEAVDDLPRGPLDRRVGSVGGARGPCAVRRGLGAHAERRGARGDRRAPGGTRAHRAPAVLGRRARRCAVPPWLLPLQALEHRHCGRSARRGADARRALGSSERPAPCADLLLALALSASPARLRGCARGRDARARARAAPPTTHASSQGRTSRLRSSRRRWAT